MLFLLQRTTSTTITGAKPKCTKVGSPEHDINFQIPGTSSQQQHNPTLESSTSTANLVFGFLVLLNALLSSMSGPLRSKQGCWTCRVRKKKCDESRPVCSTCESLSIPCYGFGARPDWIGDHDKEREVLNGFKEIVKHTSRRNAATKFPKPQRSNIRIEAKPIDHSISDSSSSGTRLIEEDDNALLQEESFVRSMVRSHLVNRY